MRSTLQRRILQLENAAVVGPPPCSEPINQRAFLARVEHRCRVKKQSFEVAVQALAIELRDDELDALIAEAEGALPESNPEAIEKQFIDSV